MHENAVHECKIMRKWNNCEIHSVCGVITDQLKFAMNCKIHPTQPLLALNHKRCSTIKCIPSSMHKYVRCSFEFGYIFFSLLLVVVSFLGVLPQIPFTIKANAFTSHAEFVISFTTYYCYC